MPAAPSAPSASQSPAPSAPSTSPSSSRSATPSPSPSPARTPRTAPVPGPASPADVDTFTVAVIVGSASEDSLNRRLAKAMVVDAPSNLEFVEAPIIDLPFYRAEFDSSHPEFGAAFKQVLADADAVLIVTPEYNRGIPAVLKNALDWASRPMATNPLSGKPVLIAGASGGLTGTAVAQSALRSIVAIFDVHLMARPELYIRIKKDQFGADGRATTPGTQDFLAATMQKFADYIESIRG